MHTDTDLKLSINFLFILSMSVHIYLVKSSFGSVCKGETKLGTDWARHFFPVGARADGVSRYPQHHIGKHVVKKHQR